ncbi:MAG: hypothetical protein KGQ80_03355 [Bacteroidetes bacterium]|nr:hypothetical protein [Bacteroidota bacterium]
MPLDLHQYTDLWKNPTPAGFDQGGAHPIFPGHTPLPAHNDYVIRENQLEDYLDIFRGFDTRAAGRGVPPIIPAVWYYPHPFFPPPGVAGFVPPPGVPNPTIRYILIAEAANPAPTYFYNVDHLHRSPYFTAPKDAFNFPAGYIPAGIPKPQVLWLLAQQGVLLLDLYPFAIGYTPLIRRALNNREVSAHFWGTPGPVLAPETIGARINALMGMGLLDPEGVKLAFMAPPILSHFLAHQINLGALPNFGTTIRMGVNATIPPVLPAPGHVIPGPLPPTFLVGPPPHASLVGLGGVVRPLGGLNSIPYYACTCYDGAGNPNSLFIQNALLP